MSARAALVNRASMSAQPVSLLCQYSTGILSPREEEGGVSEGGEDGPRRAEGRGRREGGKEKRANVGRTRFLWSLVIDENVCL